MNKMNIGLVQYAFESSFPENKTRLLETIQKLLPQNLDLIILPEIFLGSPSSEAEMNVFSEHYKNFLPELCEISKKHHVSFYGSVIEKNKSVLHNTAIYIEDGKIIASYPKIHLFKFEKEHTIYAPGTTPQIVDTKFGKMGMAVCYDLRFPELFRHYMEEGVKGVLISAQWPDTRMDHWITLLKARAIENQFYVIACNRTGTKSHLNLNYNGHSSVISPWGDVEILLSEEQITGTYVVDFDKIKSVRENFPFYQDKVL